MILNKLPCGEKKIKDATALPADVREGKVFYGKGGRQTGTLLPIEEKAIELTLGIEGDYFGSNGGEASYTKYEPSFSSEYGTNVTSMHSSSTMFQIDLKVITGFTIKGIRSNVYINTPSIGGGTRLLCRYSESSTNHGNLCISMIDVGVGSVKLYPYSPNGSTNAYGVGFKFLMHYI